MIRFRQGVSDLSRLICYGVPSFRDAEGGWGFSAQPPYCSSKRSCHPPRLIELDAGQVTLLGQSELGHTSSFHWLHSIVLVTASFEVRWARGFESSRPELPGNASARPFRAIRAVCNANTCISRGWQRHQGSQRRHTRPRRSTIFEPTPAYARAGTREPSTTLSYY